jgi:hypothetical protein
MYRMWGFNRHLYSNYSYFQPMYTSSWCEVHISKIIGKKKALMRRDKTVVYTMKIYSFMIEKSTYIYTYIRIYTYICMHVYICISMYMCMYTYMYQLVKASKALIGSNRVNDRLPMYLIIIFIDNIPIFGYSVCLITDFSIPNFKSNNSMCTRDIGVTLTNHHDLDIWKSFQTMSSWFRYVWV